MNRAQQSAPNARTAFFTRSDEGYIEAEESAQADKKRNVSSTNDTNLKRKSKSEECVEQRGWPPQGQRSLSRLSCEDLYEDIVIPTTTAAVHGDAFAVAVLFEQREREAVQPGKVLAVVFVADAGFVFAVGDVEAPMAGVFDGPMLAHGAGEAFDTQAKTADEIAGLGRLPAIAKAGPHDHADRLQPRPAAEARQVFGGGPLDADPGLGSSVSRLFRHVSAGLPL